MESKKLRLHMQGVTALLMHNPRLVNQLNDQYAVAIKRISAKTKKTEADLKEIARLEWFGGLYFDEDTGVIFQPTSKVRKCLINAARIRKLGRNVERAISMDAMRVPLIFRDMDKSVQEIFANGAYHNRSDVVIGQKRVMRTRPSFLPWALEVDFTFIPDAGLTYEQL